LLSLLAGVWSVSTVLEREKPVNNAVTAEGSPCADVYVLGFIAPSPAGCSEKVIVPPRAGATAPASIRQKTAQDQERDSVLFLTASGFMGPVSTKCSAPVSELQDTPCVPKQPLLRHATGRSRTCNYFFPVVYL
jgi:hypothetical protein